MSEGKGDFQQKLMEERKHNGTEETKDPIGDSIDKDNDMSGVVPTKHQRGLQAIKEATVSYRNFNIGCILFHVLSAVFMALFLGYLTPALIVVYFIQILFLVVNMVFYCIDDQKRMKWVDYRTSSIFLPFFVMLAFFLYDMYIFFQKLDDYHQKYALQQNVPDTQQKL